MEEKVKALLGKAREDRYILRGLKHLSVRAKDYELGAYLRDLEKSAFGDTPYDIPPPVMEYKTWTNWPESKFDDDVAKFTSEGWALDSRHFGINDDGPLLCAFLSREVPSSPPTPHGEVKMTHNFRRAMIEIANARSLVSSTDFTQEDRNRLILTHLQNVEAHVREMCGMEVSNG